MGNWYFPRRYLHAHRSPVTNTNVTDGANKFIKDAQDQYLFTAKLVALNILIFCVTNKQT